VKTTPLHDATAPVACTLSSEEVPDRLETFECIRTALQRLERTEAGLTLQWDAPPTAAGLVDQLQSFFTGTEPARLVPGLL